MLGARKIDSRFVVVEVADSGPGIPPEAKAQIFDRFYRLSAGDGFGLGLAIAREAFDVIGGRLALDARDEGGTRASVTLPLAAVLRS